MADVMEGRVIVEGEAEGELLVSSQPLSFWGGYDHQTGEIIDRRHPLSGQIARGRILAIPNTVGSSTTTAVLLEAVRTGTAPAAFLTTCTDSFLALASIVAGEMYNRPIPIVALTLEQFKKLESGAHVTIGKGGTLLMNPGARPAPAALLG
jgi:predicted aconitase with swiveling domain